MWLWKQHWGRFNYHELVAPIESDKSYDSFVLGSSCLRGH